MTPPRRNLASPSTRWLRGLALLLCLVACAGGAGTVNADAAATRAGTTVASHEVTAISSAARTSSQVRVLLRELHRAADGSVANPKDPLLRLGFTVNVIAVRAEIALLKAGHKPAAQIRFEQRVLEREIRRVHLAWRAADAGPQVAAIVRLLDGLTVDAAKASGARTSAEINAFKKAHLADVKYAGRRWLVDRKLGRQGAVIISRGVRNTRLRGAIEELYRYPAKIGDGGTADALLDEVRAGCRAGACKHWIKAGERRKQLLKIGKEEPLSATERTITDELIGALTTAIRAAGGT